MPRPRVLDDVKKREICALVTAGMSLAKVARYVGCHPKTIARERQACAEFDERMRRADMAAELSPLEAMRRASATHWRAAAWMLERGDRRADRRRGVRRQPQVDLDAMRRRVSQAVDRSMKPSLEQMKLEQELNDIFEHPSYTNCSSPQAGPPTPSENDSPTIGPGGAALPSLNEAMAILTRYNKQRDAISNERQKAAAQPAAKPATGEVSSSKVHTSVPNVTFPPGFCLPKPLKTAGKPGKRRRGQGQNKPSKVPMDRLSPPADKTDKTDTTH